jgi:broad specificity phosphatase PhoE
VTDPQLKTALIDAVWRVADRLDYVRSATIAGSFSRGTGLEGIADVDTIVIVDALDAARFGEMQHAFRAELEPILAERLFALRINPTLGPLKFNDPRTAVLHLMVYTAEGHREHVIQSPFTCLDWQRSPLWHKAELRSVYPVFGLQPHHFLRARRGAGDYLRDLRSDAVSYRQLDFREDGPRQSLRSKQMTSRDRHEFAYHVMRFLMQNFLKLVTRSNEVHEGEELLTAYFARFGEGAEVFGPLFRELRRRKQAGEFKPPVPELFERVSGFVTAFAEQFRDQFERRAVRHVVFRHAPTELNEGTGEARVFQGGVDPGLPVMNADKRRAEFAVIADAIESHRPRRVYTSPLTRAIQSLAWVRMRLPDLADAVIDRRLTEMSYGMCERLTVAQVRELYPELFAAWERGEDPPFPGGGESTAEVWERLWDFAQERWAPGAEPTLVCTHNVVLRCLVGYLLSVPQTQWYRLRIPHLAPITVVSTRKFGLFVDLEENVERNVFGDFFAGTQQTS